MNPRRACPRLIAFVLAATSAVATMAAAAGDLVDLCVRVRPAFVFIAGAAAS